MKICIFPGSFDPFTLGHLELVKRANGIFDEVIVAVLINADKTAVFTAQERIDMIRDSVTDLDKVQVDSFDGLLVDYVRAQNANVILRGLRSVSDFEYEMKLAAINSKMLPQVETVFMMAQPQYSFLSSSIVREIGSYGRDLSLFVPPQIVERVSLRLRKGS